MPRILTYNVHRCVGVDGKLDVARVAAVIAEARPDIVALQELDVRRARTGGVDQAHAIAELLDMHFHFNAAMQVEEERYGDAILSTAPLTVRKAGALPGSPTVRGLEPRGAIWVTASLPGADLQVVNTHFSLVPHEQRAQADALVGPQWMGRADCTDPAILVGDFNATPHHSTYRRIARRLRDARQGVTRARATFPSRLPLLVIDHIFVSRSVKVSAVKVVASPLARIASDHLPLYADVSIDRGGWREGPAQAGEPPVQP